MKSFLVASLFVVKETINTIIMSCCKKNPQDVSPDKVFNQDAQKDENLKYPVEDISPAEAADEEDVKSAVEELNPDPDSMDDMRG